MWNVCLFVCICNKAAATRGVLFRCRARPLIEVVMIGFWGFVCQIEMEWKPRPLCPVIESNIGNSGFVLEIPLNHKIQICPATRKETITELWILYLLEVIMIKCFPSLCDKDQREGMFCAGNVNYVYCYQETDLLFNWPYLHSKQFLQSPQTCC